MRKTFVAAMLVVLTVPILQAVTAQAAEAATGPVFPVMNTSEQPPDGVWFRNSPHQNDTNRETGFGVYANEQMQAECYSWGDAVGPYGNTVWYLGTDVSRPTVNGHANRGYMNTHYVNDGMSANQVYPGIPQCGSTPPPTTPQPAKIYYSPYQAGDSAHTVSDATVTNLFRSQWATGTCGNSASAYNSAKSALQTGQTIDTLAGWSVGRTGPAYFLQRATSTETRAVNYIILIDPGEYDELSCDWQINAGGTLANWLYANPNAHLAVISAYQISQQRSSKGIQETYFNQIRNKAAATGANLRSRVLTCNYGTSSSFSHQDAFFAGQYWIARQIINSCPTLRDSSGTFRPTAGWRP